MKPSVVKLLSVFLFFFILATTNHSCKKFKDDAQVKNEIQIVKHPLEDQFFTVADSVPNVVKKVAAYIKSRKNKSAIAANILAEVGLPVWDKSLLIMPSNAANQITNRNAGAGNDSSYIFVPIVTIGTKEVEGALACLVVADSVTIKFLKEKDYRQYGFNTTNPKNAESLVGLMMYLQNKAFGTESFVLNDERLFLNNNNAADSTLNKVVRFKNKDKGIVFRTNKSNVLIAAYYAEIEICFEMWGNLIGQVTGNLNYEDWGYYTKCYTYEAWVDDGSSTSGGGTDLSGGGTSTSGGGGSTTGSVSTQAYLQQTLGLTSTEVDFLNSYPGLSEEAYNYINNTDGQFTDEERKQMIISHINFLREDVDYLDFCATLNLQNTTIKGKTFPWFRTNSLQDDYPDLSANIQLLKLNAQQAYYLWNNSAINLQIKQFLEANNYAESAIFRVMFALEECYEWKAIFISATCQPVYY